MPSHFENVFHAERPLLSDDGKTPASDTADRRVITLPIEVQEHIIYFLDNKCDAGTIANCALVCRQWLPRSRFELYSLIPLRTRRQWTSFTSLIRQPPSSTTGYLKNVRQLYCTHGEVLGWNKNQERPWAHSILAHYEGHLSGLVCIEFDRVDWTCAHDYDLRIGRTYRSLTTLALNECSFTSVGQLHKLVTAFPALSDLTLDWIRLQSLKPLTFTAGGHPLARLNLRSYNDDVTGAVTQWLINAQLVQNLADLTWQCDSEDCWKILTEAIDGSSLRKLEFRVQRYWKGANWSCFTSLKVLTLHYSSWSLEEHLKSVIHILASIFSDHLEELHIDLNISDTAFLNSTLAVLAHFKTIDDLLAPPQFASLEHVTLKYVRFDIYIEAIRDRSLSPSGGGIVPIPGSNSQPDPSDELVSTQPNLSEVGDLRDPQHPFKIYAEPLVLRRIREELKLLAARGIVFEIEVRLRLWLQELDAASGLDGDETEETKDSNAVTASPHTQSVDA